MVSLKKSVLRLIQIRNRVDASIGPELLQIVALTETGHKDVYKDISVINDDPLGVLIAVVIERALPGVFLHILSHAIGDSSHLHGSCSRSDNETLGSSGLDT